MATSIEVLVRHKETGVESTIPYRAYLDTQSHYTLIGQVANRKLVEGDPNLQPQHQRKPSVKSAAVASVGPIIPPPESKAETKLPEKLEEPEKVKSEEPRVKRAYTKRVKETA